MPSYTPPPPDQIRRDGNRLKDERSVYLKQHAFNPLDWYPWGDEAFGRARDENKPIFLSVGYSSCHWCHVMEHEVFEKDAVAAWMNEHYVSIKVDREERPDIDAVYMEAVQAMTGGGGWPMTVFLTPELKPFLGGTYFPEPQFMHIARTLHEHFVNDRKMVDESADELYQHLSGKLPLTPDADIDGALFDEFVAHIKDNFDEKWGGQQSRMKFPTPSEWHFLLHVHRRTGDADAARMVRTTLDRMADGGIHDHLAGGFHRYTVEPTWLVPHFEKMLYDNAPLASLYMEAAAVFDDERYAEVARDSLDFMLREMRGSGVGDGEEAGGFYSSFDADTDGEEGLTYLWSPDEIMEIAGKADGRALCMLLDVTPAGNFEGRTILTRRVPIDDVVEVTGRPPAEIAALFEKHRSALKAARDKRAQPGLDQKIITAWNGQAITAFAQGYTYFGDGRYREAAERAVQYLWTVHRRSTGVSPVPPASQTEEPTEARSASEPATDERQGGHGRDASATSVRLHVASNDGEPTGDGVLDDYACFAQGLLDLYQATGDLGHLTRALALVETVLAHFADPTGETALFFLTADDTPTPMHRQIEVFDGARPSGNSVMAQVLTRAAALTGNTAWRDRAIAMVATMTDIMRRARAGASWWHDAALLLKGPLYEVVIAGDNDRETRPLLEVVRKSLRPYALAITVPAKGLTGHGPEAVALLPPAADKPSITNAEGATVATAYVCEHGTCQLPATDPDAVKTSLQRDWRL